MKENDKDGTTPEEARAQQLRERLQKISSGQATPKSPREITDAAAREQWEKEQKKKTEDA